MGRYAFLLAAVIALIGALGHFAVPALPAGRIATGCLMLVCGLYALAGAGVGGLRWLPFAPQVQGTVAAVCLLRGLLILPYWFKHPGQPAAFDLLVSLAWVLAGVAFLCGVLLTRPQPITVEPVQQP